MTIDLQDTPKDEVVNKLTDFLTRVRRECGSYQVCWFGVIDLLELWITTPTTEWRVVLPGTAEDQHNIVKQAQELVTLHFQHEPRAVDRAGWQIAGVVFYGADGRNLAFDYASVLRKKEQLEQIAALTKQGEDLAQKIKALRKNP
ncbi:MAG: hypothetical protein ACYDH4_10830 [Candidatus Cryosericum sp.]